MNIVMRLCPRVLMIAVLVSGNLVLADDLDTRVATVLKATPLIDGHNDLPWQYHRRVNNHLSQLDLASDLTQIERPTTPTYRDSGGAGSAASSGPFTFRLKGMAASPARFRL